MSGVPTSTSRFDKRRARTRAALIEAAQGLLVEGRLGVPIQEVTERADVGIGTFYNHFASKDELFAAAIESALSQWAESLDAVDDGTTDPAALFARSFRLTGRLHRLEPQISRVLLSQGHALSQSPDGMGPRARRDIRAAQEAGRFLDMDLDRAMVVVTGAMIELGHLLHERPGLDEAETVDGVTSDVLVALGLERAEAERLCAEPLPSIDATAGLG
ncbi:MULTISPECIES: TetR/AcrR family transcriptional regulator [unclassified Aeromicrobium]|uniref:TetR/AcrR family transcriptional regulator n=1 Tax=unclassified Aeromicrobium TaxID=2633570 RepID=UPI002889CD85|nr:MULTISPECIES: TetR/AcrR family transcriptional regulator [unclassified Aeromicrobium]